MLDHALQYAGYGWPVVPLHNLTADGACTCKKGKDCESAGKHPRLARWQEIATTDEEQIAKWWSKWPSAHVGVLLGERSGIIDIECDEASSEADLLKLFGGDMPVAPTFQSHRGRHRLFRWRKDLPGGAVVHIGSVEVRTGNAAKGAQSVFPPSVHAATGQPREWLPGLSPEEVDPPEVPAAVMAKIWNLAGEDTLDAPVGRTTDEWQKIAQGVGQGQRNGTAAALAGKVLKSIDVYNDSHVAIQWDLVAGWNAHCKPPMKLEELKSVFDSILQRERQQRIREDEEAQAEKFRPRDPKTGKVTGSPDWRLVIVESVPRVYRLYSPLWEGYLVLSVDDYRSFSRLAREALEQKTAFLRASFRKVWDGSKDRDPLAEQLVQGCEHIDAPLELIRPLVVTEAAYHALAVAEPIGEGEVDRRGKPCLVPDGRIVFKFNFVWEPLRRAEDQITRLELTNLLDGLGMDTGLFEIDGKRVRCKTLPKEALGIMEERLNGHRNGRHKNNGKAEAVGAQ